MGHKTPSPWCRGWRGRRVPNFSTQLPSSSHDGCYTSLEDFPHFPRCLVYATRNFPPPNTLPAAATLPTVLFPGIWASPKPCCRNAPHAGHCLPHLGTMSGAMGPEMEIWARPYWLTCLSPAPCPETAPTPQQTLAPFPLSKAAPGSICQAGEGKAGAAAEPGLSAHGRHSLRFSGRGRIPPFTRRAALQHERTRPPRAPAGGQDTPDAGGAVHSCWPAAAEGKI